MIESVYHPWHVGRCETCQGPLRLESVINYRVPDGTIKGAGVVMTCGCGGRISTVPVTDSEIAQ